jgi:ribosome maturation factor RimP
VYHIDFRREGALAFYIAAPNFVWESEMDKSQVAERVRKIAEEVLQGSVIELVHVEVVGVGKPTVRIFIDKPGGVTLDDCSEVSQQIGFVLDREDFIPISYVLEVSSPGLERKLYSLQDFEKYKGRLAKVKTHQPINGQKNFRGVIKSVEGSEIVFLDKTSGEVRFDYGLVAKANLEIDLDEELNRKRKSL